jgi:hypothetical protein
MGGLLCMWLCCFQCAGCNLLNGRGWGGKPCALAVNRSTRASSTAASVANPVSQDTGELEVALSSVGGMRKGGSVQSYDHVHNLLNSLLDWIQGHLCCCGLGTFTLGLIV